MGYHRDPRRKIMPIRVRMGEKWVVAPPAVADESIFVGVDVRAAVDLQPAHCAETADGCTVVGVVGGPAAIWTYAVHDLRTLGLRDGNDRNARVLHCPLAPSAFWSPPQATATTWADAVLFTCMYNLIEASDIADGARRLHGALACEGGGRVFYNAPPQPGLHENETAAAAHARLVRATVGIRSGDQRSRGPYYRGWSDFERGRTAAVPLRDSVWPALDGVYGELVGVIGDTNGAAKRRTAAVVAGFRGQEFGSDDAAVTAWMDEHHTDGEPRAGRDAGARAAVTEGSSKLCVWVCRGVTRRVKGKGAEGGCGYHWTARVADRKNKYGC